MNINKNKFKLYKSYLKIKHNKDNEFKKLLII